MGSSVDGLRNGFRSCLGEGVEVPMQPAVANDGCQVGSKTEIDFHLAVKQVAVYPEPSSPPLGVTSRPRRARSPWLTRLPELWRAGASTPVIH